MFLFTNKKVIGVWTFEVSCIKWMEKSEVIQKTLQWIYYTIIDFYYITKKKRLNFIGLERSRGQSIYCHIHWLARACQCILVTKIRLLAVFPFWFCFSKAWLIIISWMLRTQQITHWSWSISILMHNKRQKTNLKSSASSNFPPLHWRTPANT